MGNFLKRSRENPNSTLNLLCDVKGRAGRLHKPKATYPIGIRVWANFFVRCMLRTPGVEQQIQVLYKVGVDRDIDKLSLVSILQKLPKATLQTCYMLNVIDVFL